MRDCQNSELPKINVPYLLSEGGYRRPCWHFSVLRIASLGTGPTISVRARAPCRNRGKTRRYSDGFPHDKTAHHLLLCPDRGAIQVTTNYPNDSEIIDDIGMHLPAHFTDGCGGWLLSTPCLFTTGYHRDFLCSRRRRIPPRITMRRYRRALRCEFRHQTRMHWKQFTILKFQIADEPGAIGCPDGIFVGVWPAVVPAAKLLHHLLCEPLD